ncbi:MAG TPA: hypothetical protein PLB25_07360 [Rhodoferax sp.]|mgnify:FL=1|nr:hypothetical protein [Rhodoferax sp.]
MSVFSWLFSNAKSSSGPGPQSDGPTAAQPGLAPAAHQSLAELKQQRQLRRDNLYSVVREVMLRSEVLASNYKFKVLSLDTQGRQFLIMVDLADEKGLPPSQLTNIEQLLGSTALQRHNLLVRSVYWRQTEIQPAPVVAAPRAASRPVSASAPTAAPENAPAPVIDVAAPTPRGRGGAKKAGFDPIGQDEVLAFKRAIANAPAPARSDQPVVSGLRNSAAMTGFEDTQLLEPDDTASPLSSTQFGDL